MENVYGFQSRKIGLWTMTVGRERRPYYGFTGYDDRYQESTRM